ncbi:putative ATP binding protein [Novymonas esmeraldas]|uniref:GPN-loop GTPase 2 n=1 Tax=Novymonas esmeraldas TaxID=1808958 RepID=A0AAW0F600_9TRYP
MFGELICGPPGSGKTTYCEGKRQFLSVYDPTRPVVLLNLDPANEDVFPYPCDVDVRELVDHATVMREEGLGPNGTYLFCAAVMEANVTWVVEKVEEAVERRLQEVLATELSTATAGPALRAPYLLIDCPGQVEFYIDAQVMQTLTGALAKRLQCSLCTVHLVDAGIATRDLPTYVASCVLSLTTMIDHELPHVNVLSKWDTVPAEVLEDTDDDGAAYLNASAMLSENMDRLWRRQLRRRRYEHRMAQHFVTPAQPVPRLTPQERAEDAQLLNVDLAKDGGRVYRYTRLLMDVVEGYGLVGYVPLDVQSQEMMLRLTQEVDNALGNFF